MSTVSVTQINPDDEITAAGANLPHNQLAAAINGNLDDDNIKSVSGTKIVAATLPVAAFDTNTNPETRMAEAMSNFVASGLTWSTTSGLAATMTSGVLYSLGKRLTVSSVSSRSFTASKDTYVDIDSTGSLGYSEVSNNATAPSLASNSVRVAKVVTNGSAITSVVTNGGDSLGNLIRPIGAASAAALQNPAKFSVYRSAALNSSNVDTVIPFDTKLFDTGSNVDITTNKGRFTARVPGYYWFAASAGNNTATSTPMVTSLLKNGSLTIYGTVVNPSNSNNNTYVSGLLQLAANDYVEAAYLGGNGSSMYSGALRCWFQGYMVSAS